MKAKENAKPLLLKDHAYEQLRELILSREYPPGTFLSERRVANKLGISITPVKSALERLKNEGFVDISPQQGIIVRNLSLEEISDLFELRMLLETYIVKQLAGKLTKEQKIVIKENLNEQKNYFEQEDIVSFAKLDTDFHVLLSKFLGNREIVRIMITSADKFNLLFSDMLYRNPGRIQKALQEHLEIGEALLSDNVELAESKMEAHLINGKKLLLDKSILESTNSKVITWI